MPLKEDIRLLVDLLKMGGKVSKGPSSLEDIKKMRLVSLVDLERWTNEFKLMSRGKDCFTESEFINNYRQTFTAGDAKAFARNVFRVMDSDGNGVVDLREFVLGMSSLASDDVNRKIEWAFKVYDVDGNGSISRRELKKIIRAIFKMHGPGVSNKKDIDQLAVDLFKSMNTDGDKVISLDEFRVGCGKHKFLLSALSLR